MKAGQPIGEFMDKLYLSQYTAALIAEGAELVSDLIIADDYDIEQMCEQIKMKLFHQIRFKEEIKKLRQQREAKTSGRGATRVRTNIRREGNDYHSLDVNRALRQKGYLKETDKDIDFNSPEVMAKEPKSRIFLRDTEGLDKMVEKSTQYHAAINKCALGLYIVKPELFKSRELTLTPHRKQVMKDSQRKRVQTLSEALKLAVELVPLAGYQMSNQTLSLKKSRPTKGVGLGMKSREAKGVEEDWKDMEARLRVIEADVERMNETIDINNERISLSKMQNDNATSKAIVADNDKLNEQLKDKKEQVASLKAKIKKAKEKGKEAGKGGGENTESQPGSPSKRTSPRKTSAPPASPKKSIEPSSPSKRPRRG
eukprot:Nk52_evm19s913 gene=Nk52_evmTU19s913